VSEVKSADDTVGFTEVDGHRNASVLGGARKGVEESGGERKRGEVRREGWG